MFNVKAAVSRLEFGPKPRHMEVTDIATGHFVFSPVEGTEVSFTELDTTIRAAGYEVEAASVIVIGEIGDGPRVKVEGSDQSFRLVPGEVGAAELRAKIAEIAGSTVRVVGAWSGDGDGETIWVAEIKSISEAKD